MLTGNTLRLIPTTRIYVDQFIIKKWVKDSSRHLNLVRCGSYCREVETKKVRCAVFAESPQLKLWAVTRFSEISHVALLMEHTRGKINVEQYVRMAFPDLQVLGCRIFELNLNRGWKVNFVSRMLGAEKLSCHPASIISFAESFMTLNWKQENSPSQNTNARATKWDWCSVRVNKIQSIIICFRLIFDWITSHKPPSPPIFHSLSDRARRKPTKTKNSRVLHVYVCLKGTSRGYRWHTYRHRHEKIWGLLWPPVQIHSQRVAIVTAVGLCDQIEIDEMLHEQGHRGIYGAGTHTDTCANFTDT